MNFEPSDFTPCCRVAPAEAQFLPSVHRTDSLRARQGAAHGQRRDLDGYYELSMFKVERPMDWTAETRAEVYPGISPADYL